MTIELLFPLIDRCVQLLRMKEENTRQFLDEMVTPAYEQFERLHRGYLEDFSSYKAQIDAAQDFSEVAQAVLQRLRSDNLFTGDQRARASEFSEALRSKKPSSKLAEDIQGFADAISDYLGANLSLVSQDGTIESPFPSQVTSQRWRNSFAQEMQSLIRVDRVSDDAKKKTALAHLDQTVGEMQALHHRVTVYYMSIKKQLLSAVCR
jgi:hypothetical protein